MSYYYAHAPGTFPTALQSHRCAAAPWVSSRRCRLEGCGDRSKCDLQRRGDHATRESRLALPTRTVTAPVPVSVWTIAGKTTTRTVRLDRSTAVLEGGEPATKMTLGVTLRRWSSVGMANWPRHATTQDMIDW